ncbi:hypothetical protein [Streptomyces sp. RTd22]|nr:hypothetical protein [Streptomyces sp. RTd22]
MPLDVGHPDRVDEGIQPSAQLRLEGADELFNPREQRDVPKGRNSTPAEQ